MLSIILLQIHPVSIVTIAIKNSVHYLFHYPAFTSQRGYMLLGIAVIVSRCI